MKKMKKKTKAILQVAQHSWKTHDLTNACHIVGR